MGDRTGVHKGEGYTFKDNYELLYVTYDHEHWGKIEKTEEEFRLVSKKKRISESVITMYLLYKDYTNIKKLDSNAVYKLNRTGLVTGEKKDGNVKLTEKGKEITQILIEKKPEWFQDIKVP